MIITETTSERMQAFGPNDHDLALAFYRAIVDPTAKAVLDVLIDYPNQRLDGAAIAARLELKRHRDVAQATFLLGQIAAALGRARPWTEAQLGYAMPGEQAALLRQAREAA